MSPKPPPISAGWKRPLRWGLSVDTKSPRRLENTVFGLYDPITREQAIVILARYLSKMDPASYDYSTYTTEQCDELLAPYFRRRPGDAQARGGHGHRAWNHARFRHCSSPKADLTRIQAAALIVRTQELLPPPTSEPPTGNPHVLDWLFSDAYSFDITVDAMRLGRAAPWMPRTLTMRVRLQAEEDPAAYQETAELLVALAAQYKDEMKYEEVRVVIAIPGGAWVYDHTFTEAPDVPYPPMTSDAYHDFFYGLSGEGCETFTMKALREGDTWIIRLLSGWRRAEQNRDTYDAIYDYATSRARSSMGWRQAENSC